MGGNAAPFKCYGNVEIVAFLYAERDKFEEKEKLCMVIDNACKSLCAHPTPVTTLHEARQVKHIGTWILKILKAFFDGKSRIEAPAAVSSQETHGQGRLPDLSEAQGNATRKRKYIPKKNSAAYALLIVLWRAHQSGKPFMLKKDLIDETDKSGLSVTPIRPNAISNLSNSRDFYSGWSGMAKLTGECLVVKSSNPGKYKLTEEGRLRAEECMLKSGLHQEINPGSGLGTEAVNSTGGLEEQIRQSDSGRQDLSSDEEVHEIPRPDLRQGTDQKKKKETKKKTQRIDVRFSGQPEEERDANALRSSVLGAIPCSYEAGHSLDFNESSRPVYPARGIRSQEGDAGTIRQASVPGIVPCSSHSSQHNNPGQVGGRQATESTSNYEDCVLAVPPLDPGERFCDAYEVVLIVDSREKFRNHGSSVQQTVVDTLRSKYKVNVETRMMPVGDAMWTARHKRRPEEYALDFIVERKEMTDLWQSITQLRYKQQKLRLLNCGLKRLLYLVEGDVNTVGTTETLKTAMLSTELQDGFHVLRTADWRSTCEQYGHLTRSIIERYGTERGQPGGTSAPVCKTYKGFEEHCKEFEKDKISDVFCLQLAQIASVTENIARSIQDRFPTLISLVQAYAKLEGQQALQEKLLQGTPVRNSSRLISATVSQNVYKAIWAPQNE